jgi:hypothetical protein
MPIKDPAINRTMWFFAIVYAVEGIGQARSGIMWQPLSHWLKETMHWDPVTISASVAIFDLPWVIKPVWGAISDFVPLFGYRRRPYLVLANIAGFLAFAWVATLDTTAHDPGPDRDRLRHGDLQHAVRRAAGRNRPEKQHHRQLRQPAVALVQHRPDGHHPARRLPDRDPVPDRRLHAAAAIAAIAPLAIIGGVWLIQEPRAPHRHGSPARAPERAAQRVPQPRPLVRRRVPVPVLFQPRASARRCISR